MFDKHKLSHDGAQAEAVVLEKKVYATTTGGGRGDRMPLPVAREVRGRLDHRDLSARLRLQAGIGGGGWAHVAVRYDPADRSKIELDRHAILEAKEGGCRQMEGRGDRASRKERWAWRRRRRRRSQRPT